MDNNIESKLEEYNGKLLTIESDIKKFLLNKIKTLYDGKLDLNQFDINTLFMISSYSFSKEDMNELLHYLLNIIKSIKDCQIIWQKDEDNTKLKYSVNDNSYILTTKENYNNYEVVNLVYNKINRIEKQKKLTKN